MKIIMLLSLIIIFICLVFSIPLFTSEMNVSDYYIENTQEKSPNIVSSILWDFRAYDTLGEETVLFTSAIGVLLVWGLVCRKK